MDTENLIKPEKKTFNTSRLYRNQEMGAGDVAQWLRTHATSAEDLSWILDPALGSSQPSLIIAAGYPWPQHSHVHPNIPNPK